MNEVSEEIPANFSSKQSALVKKVEGQILKTRESETKQFYEEIEEDIVDVLGIDEPFVIGRFGTAGGADLDAKIITTSEISPEKQNELRAKIREKYKQTQPDIYIATKDNFINGRMSEPETAKHVSEHLKGEGYDPELSAILFGPNDKYFAAIALYSAATFCEFDNEGNFKESDIAGEACATIPLTQEAGIGIANYYTAISVFEQTHMLIQKNDTYSAKKKAKHAGRVAFGTVVALTEDEETREKIKRDYVEGLKEAARRGESTDRVFTQIAVGYAPPGLFTSQDKLNLLACGEIRAGSNEIPNDFDKWAVNKTLSMAAQLNAGHKKTDEEVFRALNQRLLFSTLEPIADEKPSVHAPGEELVTKYNINSEKLIIVPLYHPSGSLNGSMRTEKGKIIEPGTALNTVPAITNRLPRETIVAEDEVYALEVDGAKLKEILTNKEVIDHLITGRVLTQKDRIADVYLKILALELTRELGTMSDDTKNEFRTELASVFDRFNFLQQYSVFGHMHELIDELNFPPNEDNVKVMELQAGETIFSEGDETHGKLYFIVDGAVDIKDAGPPILKWGKTEYYPVTIHRAAFFGESALLGEDARRTATVSSSRNSIVYEIDAQWLLKEAYKNRRVRVGSSKIMSSGALLYGIASGQMARIIQRTINL